MAARRVSPAGSAVVDTHNSQDQRAQLLRFRPELKEMAASSIGAAAGLAVAGAPVGATVAAAVLVPLTYQMIKAIANSPER